jgi:hypothetical protein
MVALDVDEDDRLVDKEKDNECCWVVGMQKTKNTTYNINKIIISETKACLFGWLVDGVSRPTFDRF